MFTVPSEATEGAPPQGPVGGWYGGGGTMMWSRTYIVWRGPMPLLEMVAIGPPVAELGAVSAWETDMEWRWTSE